MKNLIKTLVLSGFLATCSFAHATEPQEYFFDITPDVTITLTEEPCTMFTATRGKTLFRAYAVDNLLKEAAEGCFSVEPNNLVEIQLVNNAREVMYGYILHQSEFRPKANF